jgi:hypothetical protein
MRIGAAWRPRCRRRVSRDWISRSRVEHLAVGLGGFGGERAGDTDAHAELVHVPESFEHLVVLVPSFHVEEAGRSEISGLGVQLELAG